LLEVGGKPLLWHVVSIYAAHGFDRFFALTGYLGERIAEFTGSADWPEGISVECIPTGAGTPTGGRILAAREAVGEGSFCVTYGDGVADINLDALLEFHHDQGRVATMTVVRPDLPWGVVGMDGAGAVTGFEEKPRIDSWINGGFFCFEPGIFDLLEPDSVLEREPLETLAREGGLGAFRHHGFWDCVDTYKDLIALNDLWAGGEPPWKRRPARV